ncbi:MAG: hypothetical protein P9L98_05435 [Candidatus Kaelpia imicola]|nr:hypothetical protein [Candidatus Kaelpia imicola]
MERRVDIQVKVYSYSRTSVDGVFSADGVTDVPEKQIIIAYSKGLKACLSVFKYLSTHKL